MIMISARESECVMRFDRWSSVFVGIASRQIVKLLVGYYCIGFFVD